MTPAPLIGFYGDDFTGSAAVMEALAFAGLPCVLFFGIPDAAALAAAGPQQAIGIAGLSRAMPPAWMDAHLPAAFRALGATGAPIVHYKICSTFDSAPNLGSIGRAVEIGLDVLGGDWVPVLTAAPAIGRWQAFGTLFAASGAEVYRLDRHPVMTRHPATPMHEADLRLHLARQTALPVGLVDLASLEAGTAAGRAAREHAAGRRILLLDTVGAATLRAAGALIWEGRGTRRFVAGSQGVEHALIAHWQATGALPPAAEPPAVRPCGRIAVVSGSCSPVTEAQIRQAGAEGFRIIPCDALRTLEPADWEREIARCIEAAAGALAEGADPLICTARGPADPAIAALNAAGRPDAVQRIGEGLGRILEGIVRRTGLRRVVVAGGDSSGQACLAMGLTGVTALAAIEPSAPLCRAISPLPHLDGLEIALKGGQMGTGRFFAKARGG